jgi:hypothetical protein
MAILPTKDAVVRFDQNEDRFNKFINETGTYTTNSGLPAVETLPSFMARNNEALNLLTATNVKGDWTATTVYSVWDEVKYSGTWYRCVVAHTSTGSFDSTKWRISQGVSLGQLSASDGANLVGFAQPVVGAVSRTVYDKFYDIISLKDYGAVGDGITDDLAAIQKANAAGLPIWIPKPINFYKSSSPVVITVPVICGLYKIFNTDGNIKFSINSVPLVYPEWWGAKAEYDGSGYFDSTSAIQCATNCTDTLNTSTAINEGTTLRIPVSFSMGCYYLNNISVTHPIRWIGAGMKNTLLKSLNTNTNLINITSVEPVEFYDLSFGVKDSIGAMTGGSYLRFDPLTYSNQYSKIVRCAFNNAHNFIDTVDAMFIEIESCYFNKYSGLAITIGNGLLPDGGDSIITENTFNNGTGTAIYQLNSGGLRITNNKFLGGDYGYHGVYEGGDANRTGQLIISDNSFDQCNVANIAFNHSTDTPFSMVSIKDNIIVVSPNKFGVLVNGYVGVTFLRDLAVGGNTFYLRNGATGVHLASCTQVSIEPNMFKADPGDTTVGVIISPSFPVADILIHPQKFGNVTTQFSGSVSSAAFVCGKIQMYAGNPNNNVQMNYIGEELLDTTNNKWYKASGMTGNQWAALN